MAEFQSIPELTVDPNQDPQAALEEMRRIMDQVLRQVNLLGWGKIGSIMAVTLDANAASTTFTHPYIWASSTFLWAPTTANAAAELVANGPPVPSAILLGSVTVGHVNNAQTDRTFDVTILG